MTETKIDVGNSDFSESVDLMSKDDGHYDRTVYAIYDKKSRLFSAPYIAENDDAAVRIFGDMCYFGGDNLIARHPEDYLLYSVGQFSVLTGLIFGKDLVVTIISAEDVIKRYKEHYSKLNKVEKSSEVSSDPS